jgi:hypothetical protein
MDYRMNGNRQLTQRMADNGDSGCFMNKHAFFTAERISAAVLFPNTSSRTIHRRKILNALFMFICEALMYFDSRAHAREQL